MRKGSRYVADPTLAGLAICLKGVNFDTTLEDHREFVQAIIQDRARNVSCCPDGKTYRVRMYIGGKQRTIGLTEVPANAARFADMARIFFWPYRLRDCREPSLADMNFSVEQANEDLATNERAVELLTSIRDHFINHGMLTLREPSKKEGRRTSRHEIVDLRDNITRLFAEQQKKNLHIFGELKQAFHHILERLTALEENAKKKDT